MPLTIPITGLAANDPVPGTYVEVAFAVGPTSGGTTTYGILLIGNKTAAGTAAVETVYGPTTATPLASLNDAATLWGTRSEGYRMYKRCLSVNPTAPIFMIAPAASTGAAATLTVTVATTATANGTMRLFFADEFVDTGITSGDTPTVIAGNVVTNINAKFDWPFTASNVAGVITLTASNLGLRGNWLRAGAIIFGSGVGTTVTPAPMSFFSGGTVSDSYTNTLAAINPNRYYYIASADDGGQGSTNLTNLVSQVATQALPTTGIRQVVFAGGVDTVPANINTIAIAQNSARCQIVYEMGGDVPPSEMAALVTGAKAFVEAAFSAASLNFDFFGTTIQSQALWKLPAPRGGQALTRVQIASALNNGVSPVGVNAFGKAYLVSLITTRSQSSGSADYRIRDAHKVSIMDRYGDDLQTKVNLQCAGKVIGDDPAVGQRPPGPNVVTPRVLRALTNKQTNEYGENDLLQQVPTIIAGTVAIRETSPTTRLSEAVPLQTVDVLHQVGLYLAQVA